MVKVLYMPRSRTKTEAVTVGEAKPGSRVKVQLVMPYELLLELRKENYRRAALSPEDMPSVSDVVCELLRAGLDLLAAEIEEPERRGRPPKVAKSGKR